MIYKSIFKLFYICFTSNLVNGQTVAKEPRTPYRDHLSSIKKTYEWGTYIREDDIVHATENHTGTIIFLHGHISHGSAMRVWVEWMRQNMSDFPHMKIIYPTAPFRYYSIFPEARQKEKFEIWFDLDDCTPNGTEYLEYLHLSAQDLKQIVQEEVDAGIPLNRIIIGGFSYGGTMALHMGYRYLTDVAGVFTLSTYLQNNSTIYKELPSKDHYHLPVLLMAHGDEDPFVKWQWGRETFEKLKAHGVVGTFHIIPKAEHKLTIWEIDLLWRWVRRICPQRQINN